MVAIFYFLAALHRIARSYPEENGKTVSGMYLKLKFKLRVKENACCVCLIFVFKETSLDHCLCSVWLRIKSTENSSFLEEGKKENY